MSKEHVWHFDSDFVSITNDTQVSFIPTSTGGAELLRLKTNAEEPAYAPAHLGNQGIITGYRYNPASFTAVCRADCNVTNLIDFYDPFGFSVDFFYKSMQNIAGWSDCPFSAWELFSGTSGFRVDTTKNGAWHSDAILRILGPGGVERTINGSEGAIYDAGIYHHYKVVYSGWNNGNEIRFFVNGDFKGKLDLTEPEFNYITHRNTDGSSFANGSDVVDIMGYGTVGICIGCMDELRIVMGRHDNDSDDDFTVPVLPYTDSPGSSFYLRFS